MGATVVISSSADAAKRVLSQMKRIARAIWSNPPMHGAKIAAEVCSRHWLSGQLAAVVMLREYCMAHTSFVSRTCCSSSFLVPAYVAR